MHISLWLFQLPVKPTFLNFPHTLELVATVVALGEQTASTDNFLGVFGHGSAPKLLLDAVTKHVCWPMHS